MTYQAYTLRPQSAMLTLYGDYPLNREAKIGIGILKRGKAKSARKA